MASVSVVGADDASICDNQCQTDLFEDDRLLLSDLVALSIESVRISNNYVKRLNIAGTSGGAPAIDSITSFSAVNTTSMNHVSGAIKATGLHKAETDNLELIT